jgi:Na+/H+ antiporter NhaD/arsenite permease-like protein
LFVAGKECGNELVAALAAILIGVDLGPNLSVTGSLALFCG